MASQRHFQLLLRNASQIVQVTNDHSRYVRGREMDQIAIIPKGSMIVDDNGKIAAIGTHSEIEDLIDRNGYTFSRVYDCRFKESVIPGLVDCHTHPVWSGDRCNEWGMKLRGASYMDIHKAGGGIGFTVDCVRRSSFDELLALFVDRLKLMSMNGTTLLEAKSGYGLDTQTEIKMLKVIERANELFPAIDIISNFCGGHSVPKEHKKDPAKYVDQIINEQLPAVHQLGLKTLKQIGMIYNESFVLLFGSKGSHHVFVNLLLELK